jgi:hypothetical protein
MVRSTSRSLQSPSFRPLTLVAIAIGSVVVTAQAALAVTPVPVLAAKNVDEFQPSASANYLVWTQNSEEHPRHANTYAQAPGGEPIRVNEPGTQSSWAAIDGTTVLYARSEPREGADLRLYDVRTGRRSAPGDGVNTRYFEYQPNIFGNYFFFERAKFAGPTQFMKLILYDRRTGRSTVLAEVDPRHGFLDSDQINGDWLVWEYCAVSHRKYTDCDVFRYRISTQHAVRLPNPGVQQYSPAVTSDGTVYYIRQAGHAYWKCGTHTRLVRYPLGGPATILASVEGKDVFAQFALEGQYGLVTDYFDETRCRDLRSDIYKLDDIPGG